MITIFDDIFYISLNRKSSIGTQTIFKVWGTTQQNRFKKTETFKIHSNNLTTVFYNNDFFILYTQQFHLIKIFFLNITFKHQISHVFYFYINIYEISRIQCYSWKMYEINKFLLWIISYRDYCSFERPRSSLTFILGSPSKSWEPLHAKWKSKAPHLNVSHI